MNTLKYMRKLTDESDENLVALLSSGNKQAFDELYTRYEKPLFLFFMKMLNSNREKCEDFLQDLFMTLFEKTHYFDQSRKFKPWLYSIAHNMVKNEYKKMSVRSIMSNDADTELVREKNLTPDQKTEEVLFAQELDFVLNKIDPEIKSAFLLKYQQGFAINEIAQMQNVKEGTVKSRLFYVKKHLSKQLASFKPNV